ncbi:hypothetical protein TNCV_2669611 [Trichonephila clavipes]|nr:hypothetical protein TNCV_2669611 [Trichonephila clavipes]
MNDIGVLKRAENSSNTITTLDDRRLLGTPKIAGIVGLRWCLNVFGKIVVKHLNKSLKIHTSLRRRKRPSSGRSGTDIFCVTTPQHIDPSWVIEIYYDLKMLRRKVKNSILACNVLTPGVASSSSCRPKAVGWNDE